MSTFNLIFVLFFVGYHKLSLGSIEAKFTAEGSHIDGEVIVCNGNIEFELDISEAIGMDPINQACIDGGFTYHIHYWDSGLEYTEGFGGQCGFNATQNHFDPWHACARVSNNPYCNTGGQNEGNFACIPVDDYSCNVASNEDNPNFPFNCEIGDLGGKYGFVFMDENNKLSISANEANSFWGINEKEIQLINGSIVFHCANNGDRAFCAKFGEPHSDDEHDYDYVRQPNQRFNALGMQFKWDESDQVSSYVQFNRYGDIHVNISSTIPTPGALCEDYAITIWNEWTDNEITYSTNNAVCLDMLETQYDPTHQCFGIWSDSEYCQNGILCEDPGYQYSCDSTNYNNNRYGCSPSDISGKVSTYNPSTTLSSVIAGVPGGSTVIPPMNTLIGKSIAIHCPNTKEFLVCGKITEIDSPFPEPVIVGRLENITGGEIFGFIAVWILPLIIIGIGCLWNNLHSNQKKYEEYLLDDMKQDTY